MAGSAHDRARTGFGFSGGFLPSVAPRPIDASTAVVTFIGSWTVAQVVSAVILVVVGDADAASDASFGVLAIALLGAWASYLIGMWIASQRAGSGNMIADYGFTFRWADVVGLAIGAGSQLVVIRVVYLPLEALWPDTFTQDRLTENAQDLVDRAGGASTLLLVAVVVIGAPVVEELFYRGLLQRSLAARFNEGAVLVGVAAIFAAAHFRPIEFPGLFVFGLILGGAALRAKRLGPAITIHIGFNLTGLLLVL
ncbi:MAG TPA: CPBP family intramembrane glutamic endopeptidase [Ilumatobacteraceae bacterium]|nr:CPBP family intramembrane glutamic endopeptidase [Ilumatobacteraceae bacterium]